MATDKKQFVLPNTQVFGTLNCTKSFQQLTKREQLYAHYLCKTSASGALIAFVQSSPEAPLIFSLLLRLYSAESIENLKENLLAAGIDQDGLMAFFIYSCGFFENAGNYKGSGNSKIVPNIDCDTFERIIKLSKAYANDKSTIDSLWSKCKKPMFLLIPRTEILALSPKGITMYFSDNCTIDDSNLIVEWMKMKKFEAQNSRAFKTIGDNDRPMYDIRLASIEENEQNGITFLAEIFKGSLFKVTRGDYSKLLSLVVDGINKAKNYAANDNQINMLEHFIKSFQSGSLDEHKDGCRYWIKDKGPIIETHMGFVFSYRDPSSARAEFSAFVSILDKNMSAKLDELINEATKFLPLLPWGSDFEKDKFLQPDFTSVDVLSFTGSMLPAGVNLPAHEDIKQNEGFKNISLGNVILNAYQSKELPFLSDSDAELMRKYKVKAFEAQVALHELFGHGSGKIFRINSDGTFNFEQKTVRNPLTNDLIDKWYEPGETYNAKFGAISQSFEECRAETVGLYLCLNSDVMKILGYTDEQEISDLIYVNWLLIVWIGAAQALQNYNPTSKQWLQAHRQARFVITNVLLEAGHDLLKIDEIETNENLRITFDRSKINTIGKKAIGDFMIKLQVFKSTGDIVNATKLYNHYSEVNESGAHPWAKWRDIVMKKLEPRPILAQSNIELDGDAVIYKSYEPTCEGYLQSWIDRYSNGNEIYEIFDEIWHKDKFHYSALIDD